jgi:subtilisin
VSHEAFADNLGEGTAFNRAGWFHLTPWDDDGDHGTHCAGTIAATTEGGGVVPETTLHAVKVLGADGTGTSDDIAAGIEHAADQGYDVLNLSLAGPKAKVVRDACSYADRQGCVLVAAAGGDDDPAPGTYDSTIAVGGTDEDGAVADFSPDGAVDLLAPGEDVRSAVPGGYDLKSGNSMACAHVSGVAAALLSDGFEPTTVDVLLSSSAEDLGYEPRMQGDGLVDAAAALGYDSDED